MSRTTAHDTGLWRNRNVISNRFDQFSIATDAQESNRHATTCLTVKLAPSYPEKTGRHRIKRCKCRWMLILLAFRQLWRNLRDIRWINRRQQEVSLWHGNGKMSRRTLNRKSKWFNGKQITVARNDCHSLILQYQRKIMSCSIWVQPLRTTVCRPKVIENRLPLDRTCFKRARFKSVDFEPSVHLARMDAEEAVGTHPFKPWLSRTQFNATYYQTVWSKRTLVDTATIISGEQF